MLSIPCFNTLKIPKLMIALEANGYETQAGLAKVWVETRTDPPTSAELQSLQRIVGAVFQDEPSFILEGGKVE